MARSRNHPAVAWRPIANNQGRHISSRTKSHSPARHNQGFSVVYVLTASLILIAGTATLLNQSASSMLGSIFQGQSQQARHVARSGMAYLISQINKEENRHLLVLPQSAETINPNAATSLWTDVQAATNHLNPCTKIYAN